MSEKYAILARAADVYFSKCAGLVKVPQELLSDITNWAKGCYCNQLLRIIETFENGNRKRMNNSAEDQKLLSSRMFEIFETMGNASYEGLKISIEEELKTHRSISLIIHQFSVDKIDPETGFTGTIGSYTDRPRLAFYLFVYDHKSSGDKYGKARYSFCINDPKTKLRIDHNSDGDVDLDHVLGILIKYDQEIKEIIEDFIDFTNDFSTASDEYLKSIAFMKKVCEKYSEYVKNSDYVYDSNASKNFEFDLQKIPYLRSPVTVGNIQQLRCNLFFDRKEQARFTSSFKEDEKEWNGLWIPDAEPYHYGCRTLGNVALYVDKPTLSDMTSPHKLQQVFQHVDSVIRHELQHLVQTYIGYFNSFPDKNYNVGGLPSEKLRSKKHDFNGIPVEQGFSEEQKNEQRQTHALRDIEFHTRLGNEVMAFKNIKNRFPLSLHQELVKVWIGQVPSSVFKEKVMDKWNIERSDKRTSWNSNYMDGITFDMRYGEEMRVIYDGTYFFNKLKEHAPEKYQKAVKEFYKAVL